jgi:hypothetical protein
MVLVAPTHKKRHFVDTFLPYLLAEASKIIRKCSKTQRKDGKFLMISVVLCLEGSRKVGHFLIWGNVLTANFFPGKSCK